MSTETPKQIPSPNEGVAPAFVIGRDPDGHWLAVETRGRGGGLFSSREAASRYAAFETDHRIGAVLVTADPIALRL